ncbi:MAG: hypothetical protein ACYCWN_07815 [Ferrimicrobium sp.]
MNPGIVTTALHGQSHRSESIDAARESDWISRRRILVDEMAKCGAEPPKTEAAHAACKSRFNRRLLRCDGVKKGCRVADAQESDALDE